MYKQKYLKYKMKYINLQMGGACFDEGFVQHTGECWHDALITLFTHSFLEIQDVLLDPEFSNIIRRKFNTLCTFNEMRLYSSLYNLRPENEEIVVDYFVNLQRKFIIKYVVNQKNIVLNAYITDTARDKYDNILRHDDIRMRYDTEYYIRVFIDEFRNDHQRPVPRNASSYYSIACTTSLIRISMLNIMTRDITDEDVINGGTMYNSIYGIYLLKYFLSPPSLFIRFKPLLINLTDIKKYVDYDNVRGLYIGTNLHAICCYQCGDREYYYDDNNTPPLEEFFWSRFFADPEHTSYHLLHKIPDYNSKLVPYNLIPSYPSNAIEEVKDIIIMYNVAQDIDNSIDDQSNMEQFITYLAYMRVEFNDVDRIYDYIYACIIQQPDWDDFMRIFIPYSVDYMYNLIVYGRLPSYTTHFIFKLLMNIQRDNIDLFNSMQNIVQKLLYVCRVNNKHEFIIETTQDCSLLCYMMTPHTMITILTDFKRFIYHSNHETIIDFLNTVLVYQRDSQDGFNILDHIQIYTQLLYVPFQIMYYSAFIILVFLILCYRNTPKWRTEHQWYFTYRDTYVAQYEPFILEYMQDNAYLDNLQDEINSDFSTVYSHSVKRKPFNIYKYIDSCSRRQCDI